MPLPTRVTAAAALVLGTSLAAQPHAPLARGSVVDRRLGPGATDEFTLPVAAPAFVFADVDQRSVDVAVTVLDSAGRVLGQFDGPARGPERFTFTAEHAGTYRIRVAAFQRDSGGDYTLHVRRVDRLATTPAAKVDQLMAPYDSASPGAAIGVLRGGKLVFAKGYGRASLEYPAPITPRTVFHVASVSKQFTAMGVVLLSLDGKLSLDDDVRKYVPELPQYEHTVTIRHLLNHTSGIRDQWDLWGMSGGRMDDVITQDDLFRLVTRQRALNFAPGAEYMYSNSGFMLLARIVERVGGKPFPAFMKERVFDPLGMRDTRVHMDHEEVVPGRAYSYATGPDGGYRNSVLSYANAGATSLFTTVEDLARWLENFRTGTVGGTAARERMLTRGVRTSGDTLPYASGVLVDTWRGQRRIWHNGADAGFRSHAMFFPDLDAGVIVLSNLASFDPSGIASQVAAAFFGDALAPAPAPARPSPVVATAASVTIDPARLDALTGDFASPTFSFTATRERDQLFVQAPGQPRFALRATSDSTFVIPEVSATLTFLRRGARTDTARLLQNGGTMVLTRRAPYAPSAADLAALVGRYYSPELDVAYDLALDGSALVLRRRHNPDMPLAVRGRDSFGGTWPVQTLRVDRDSAGRVAGFRVTSGRVRDERFVRQSTPTPNDSTR